MAIPTKFIVAVVCFDHRIGPEVEFVYPPPEEHREDESWQNIKDVLPLLALPSRHEAASDKTSSTCFFFHIPSKEQSVAVESWKGVAYYDVIHPHAVHGLDDDTLAKFSRGAIQKSVVVVSKTPYQAYVKAKLEAMANQFFAQSSFGDVGLVVELHDALSSVDFEALSWPQLHVGLPLPALVRATDVHLAGLLRLLLAEGRIVFYSSSPEVVSSSVLAFLSFLPGGAGDFHATPSRPHVHRYRWAKYGLPLAIVHPSSSFRIEPYLISTYAAILFHQPEDTGGFIAGTCDPMCLKFNQASTAAAPVVDAVVDLDVHQVVFHSSSRATAAATLGSQTRDFFNRILAANTALLHDESRIDWVGSEGWIRQQVQVYLEQLLMDVAVEPCRPMRSSFWNLLTSSQIESQVSAEHNPAWLQLWYGTFNYNQWRKSHRLHDHTTLPPPLPPPPSSGKRSYTYPNGDTYEGEFVDRKRHGQGTYVVANTSFSYDGHWAHDLRHGVGTLRSMQGMYCGAWVRNEKCGHGEFSSVHETYTGQWRHNVYHGQGKLIQPQWDYEGEFSHGHFHGMGKCTFRTHSEWKRYRGEWCRGEFHGFGTLEYGNADVYVGDFISGKRHGQGTLTTAGGSSYSGEWKGDMQDGHGRSYSSVSGETKEGTWKCHQPVEGKHAEWVILYPNNDKFIGTTQSGRPWGQGICRYENGSVYTGAWVDGLREGLGIFCDYQGRTFEGEWRNSQPWKEQSISPYVDVSLEDKTTIDGQADLVPPTEDGVHVFVYANGDVYSGTFRKGCRHGVGKYTSKLSRHVYDGEWDMDQRHGQGILTSGSSDFIYDGDWCRDTRTGKGTCVIRGAETYTGDWEENRFHGMGMYTAADGSVFEGEFVHGIKQGMGKLSTADNHVYHGEFVHGERCGVLVRMQTGTCILANGRPINGMEKARWYLETASATSVNGPTMFAKDMAATWTPKARRRTGRGAATCRWMATGIFSLRAAVRTMGSVSVASPMVMACVNTRMGTCTAANGWMGLEVDGACVCLQMATCSKASGRLITCR
ncbi:hypothetical protein, variant [Aphanomyces astaci]|uniref:UDENN domain-containing protein n=1 Tax=Aphanomyces astaci TaxID=112090 RepID=W4GKE8_APHAT|nr:hypothetical protein, variant [Aphanomyces astaci]ETV79393.1 hypothetical protein, variant [Aphanomyces astaci]|eukprot:XP_009831234.1 hypothetical protein, variant [Aphanomyces astaci]